MRRIDMKVLLPILGLGALAFALGSSKKTASAQASASLPKQRTGSAVTNASVAGNYPSAEGLGDVSDAPVRLVPIKAAPQKANGAS